MNSNETSIWRAHGGLTRNSDERGRPDGIGRVDQEPPSQSGHPVAHELRIDRTVSVRTDAGIHGKESRPRKGARVAKTKIVRDMTHVCSETY
jgi:hypothetical protein